MDRFVIKTFRAKLPEAQNCDSCTGKFNLFKDSKTGKKRWHGNGDEDDQIPCVRRARHILNITDRLGVTAQLDDAQKYRFIKERKPEPSFTFPFKEYKDKRHYTGVMKRSCQHRWFELYNFITYSENLD